MNQSIQHASNDGKLKLAQVTWLQPRPARATRRGNTPGPTLQAREQGWDHAQRVARDGRQAVVRHDGDGGAAASGAQGAAGEEARGARAQPWRLAGTRQALGTQVDTLDGEQLFRVPCAWKRGRVGGEGVACSTETTRNKGSYSRLTRGV